MTDGDRNAVLAPDTRAGGRMSAGELDRAMPPGLCAWPIGDPCEADFRYCRTPVAAFGEPYCAKHRARAWRTPETSAADRVAWLAEQQRRRGTNAA